MSKKGPYVVQPSRRVGRFDVVRCEPTIVSQELRQGEAEALAYALNAQIQLLEGKNP